MMARDDHARATTIDLNIFSKFLGQLIFCCLQLKWMRARSLYNCCLYNVCGHGVNVTYNCFPIRCFHSFHSRTHQLNLWHTTTVAATSIAWEYNTMAWIELLIQQISLIAMLVDEIEMKKLNYNSFFFFIDTPSDGITRRNVEKT